MLVLLLLGAAKQGKTERSRSSKESSRDNKKERLEARGKEDTGAIAAQERDAYRSLSKNELKSKLAALEKTLAKQQSDKLSGGQDEARGA